MLTNPENFGTLSSCVQHRHGHCIVSSEVRKSERGENLGKTNEPRINKELKAVHFRV